MWAWKIRKSLNIKIKIPCRVECEEWRKWLFHKLMSGRIVIFQFFYWIWLSFFFNFPILFYPSVYRNFHFLLQNNFFLIFIPISFTSIRWTLMAIEIKVTYALNHSCGILSAARMLCSVGSVTLRSFLPALTIMSPLCPSRQLAAVNTHHSDTMIPPQKCLPSVCRDTTYGNSFRRANIQLGSSDSRIVAEYVTNS